MKCPHCGQREATISCVSDSGMLAVTHGVYLRWCELCATTMQLEYARASAARIPELEAKLARLVAGEEPRE